MTEALLEALLARYSPRQYDARPLDDSTLFHLFEAARWAPSSYNRQPWRFLVTRRGTTAYQGLLATLSPFNRQWAQTAPVLVLVAAVISDERGTNTYAWHDVGLACGLLTAQAAALGIYPHFVAGFDKEKARQKFHLPGEMQPVTVITLGYPDKTESPRTRTRLPLGDIVYESRWGHAPPWAKRRSP